MKKNLYAAYFISFLLVVWPIVTYFLPFLISQNLYNLIFISGLSLSVVCLVKSDSFTVQVNASWIITNLILFFTIREFLLLILNILTSNSLISNSTESINYILLFVYLTPLTILTCSIFYGVINTSKHKLPFRWYSKIIKHLVGRRALIIDSQNVGKHNEFNLTIDPNAD